MKITVVTGPFIPIPPGPAGAVEKIWVDLCKEFAKGDHEIEILARSFPNSPKIENIKNLKFTRSSGFDSTSNIYFNICKDFFYSWQKWREIHTKTQILVTNCFWLPFLMTYFKQPFCKVVVCVERMPKGQMFLYKRVNRLIAVTNSVKSGILEENPLLESLVKVIPNPVNDYAFKPPPKPRTEPAKKVILFAGRIHPEKGLEILAHAFKLLCHERKDVILKIIGPWKETQGGGGAKFKKNLCEILEGTPAHICDPIFDPIALCLEYHYADLFCYPSIAEKGEAFGVAPLEAMATGLPVIVSNLSCFKDFIEHGKTGYIFEHQMPTPVKELVNLFNGCLSDFHKAILIGRAASEKAKEFFALEIAQKYLADFNDLLSNKG